MEDETVQNDEPSKLRPALGFWSGYFYIININIGAAFLSMPYAFDESGWLFSFFFLVGSAIQSSIITFLIFEIMSKVEVLIRQKEEGQTIPPVNLSKLFKKWNNSSLLPNTSHNPEITERRIDFFECIRLIYGNKPGAIYIFLITLYYEGTQLGLTVVFATSMTSIVPIFTLEPCNLYNEHSYISNCKFKYWFWLFVYAVCMIFIVIRGMTQEKWLQLILGWTRLFLIALMVICCLVSIITEKSQSSDDHHTPEMPMLINLKKLGVAVPIIMECSLYHECISSIIEHVENKEKNLPWITILAGITMIGCYSLLGLIIPAGVENLNSVASLTFRNYSAGYSQSDRPWWTYIIEYFVILFPAINVFSSFPIFSLANANNLVTLFYGTNENIGISKCAEFWIRVLVCLPPLLGAGLVSDLGTVLEWIGLLGFIVIPITVPLVYIGAEYLVPQESPYRYFKTSKVSFRESTSLGIAFLNITLVVLSVLFNIKVID